MSIPHVKLKQLQWRSRGGRPVVSHFSWKSVILLNKGANDDNWEPTRPEVGGTREIMSRDLIAAVARVIEQPTVVVWFGFGLVDGGSVSQPNCVSTAGGSKETVKECWAAVKFYSRLRARCCCGCEKRNRFSRRFGMGDSRLRVRRKFAVWNNGSNGFCCKL